MLKFISKAYAQYGPSEPLPPGYCEELAADPNKWDTLDLRALTCVFYRVYNTVIASVGAVFIIWMIVSGIRYMSAGGDEKAIADARGSLTHAVLGFILVLGAYALIAILGNVLGGGLGIPYFEIPAPSP